MSSTTVTLVDGVRVVVPDSLTLITPYVLHEQLDWFEDEIKFLRQLLQPGQKVIDIGANHGVYTLSMAQRVGANGQVWAFEPATQTAAFLAESIAANEFTQIVLDGSALSSRCGTAQLSLNMHSELNALVANVLLTDASETVPMTTLDTAMEHYGWNDIDFLKIDAEGEESNILLGGKRFFKSLSPLVQYEIKHAFDQNMDLVQQFMALGYTSYRLVPGLNVLIPLDLGTAPDEYLLNVFCCKPDRAERLATAGFLLEMNGVPKTTTTGRFDHLADQLAKRSVYGWEATMTQLPYSQRLLEQWQATMANSHCTEVDKALSCYAISQDTNLRVDTRFDALELAFYLLKTLVERDSSYLRLSSIARVACAYGFRQTAVNALDILSKSLIKYGQPKLGEPFLVPGLHFDTIAPRESINDWLLAAVLDELERLACYSSFYGGKETFERLKMIEKLDFGNAEMQRRLTLFEQRLQA